MPITSGDISALVEAALLMSNQALDNRVAKMQTYTVEVSFVSSVSVSCHATPYFVNLMFTASTLSCLTTKTETGSLSFQRENGIPNKQAFSHACYDVLDTIMTASGMTIQ